MLDSCHGGLSSKLSGDQGEHGGLVGDMLALALSCLSWRRT